MLSYCIYQKHGDIIQEMGCNLLCHNNDVVKMSSIFFLHQITANILINSINTQ